MPQGKRKSAVEIFEAEQRPARRRSAVEIFEQEQPTAPAVPQPSAPTGEAPGFLENLGIGGRRTLLSAADAGRVIEDAVGEFARGNLDPLKQIAELAGRGLFQLVTEPLVKGAPSVSDQNPQIAAIKQEQAARIATKPELFSREAQAERERLNAIAARDPSRFGKATRGIAQGVTAAVPAVVTGIATGGSLPAIAGVTGLQTLDQPENLALNVTGAVTPLPLGRLVAPILRRIRGAKGAPEIPGISPETPAPSPSLAKAIGEDAFDSKMVSVEELGLAKVPQPTRPANALPVNREIPVDAITLSRDNLSRGRMFQAQEGLKQGLKREGETFTTLGGQQRIVEPIQVVPDPQNPGRFIVEGDGNHRVALLKMQAYEGLIPVKSFETAAQSGQVDKVVSALTENYYRPPAALPELEAAAPKPFEVSANLSEAKPRPGAVGPRISEYGFVEGGNPSVVKPEERTKILETISALRKAGLLTGVKTHLKNIGGNAGFALSEEASRIPAAIADLVVSPITGRRTITGPSPVAMARSLKDALTKGLSEAKEIIKKGVSDADAARLELKELNSGSKIVNTYVNGVFRLLNAEDKVFRTYAYRRALEDRARSIALTEIRSGEITRGQYGQRVRELIDQPPESLAASAVGDAEVATFTERNKFAEDITQFREGRSQLGKFGFDLLLPFVKTPTNIIKRILEYTPLGVGKAVLYDTAKSIIKGSMTEAEQRAFAQSFGRGTIGSGLIALGAKLYADGKLTGFREDDPKRAARDEAAGRTPGSIRVGDRWYQIVGFSPVGNLMAIGATIQRESNQERDDALKAYLEAGAQAVGEQPLLIGAQQIASALKQPGTFTSKTLGGVAGSFVPTMVSDIGQIADTERRQTDTFPRQIENRIPGLRNTLPAKPDVLGRPIPLPMAFDPTRSLTAQEANNPLMAELVRLDQGISGFEKKKTESEEEFAEKQRTFGQLYGQYGLTLINSPSYKNQDDVAKQEIFDLFNQRLKTLITENQERFANAKLSPPVLLQAFRESQQRKLQKRQK